MEKTEKRTKNIFIDEYLEENGSEIKVPEEILGEEEKEESPAEMETTGPETKNGIIENSLIVNLRREPSLESPVLEVLNRGDKVTIVDKKDNFYKVSVRNRIGYILSDFVKEE